METCVSKGKTKGWCLLWNRGALANAGSVSGSVSVRMQPGGFWLLGTRGVLTSSACLAGQGAEMVCTRNSSGAAASGPCMCQQLGKLGSRADYWAD